MFLVVGLGNPGSGYAGNRHNIGFMAAQDILRRHGFSAWREKFRGQFATGDVAGDKAALLLPHTYMNLSGESVQAAAQFFKVAPAQVVVLHDELDLELGRMRLKKGGGDGGHNGLKSITQHLGTPQYWRVRMGIGHPGNKDLVSPYVLSDFRSEERATVATMCERVADALPLILAGESGRAMNVLCPPPPKPPRPAPSGPDKGEN